MKPGSALALALAGVGVWSTLIEPQLFTVRRHTLATLPPGAAPLRVLHLSDLHLAPWQHRKIAWVRSLAELRPDLIVLTGDLMGHRAARGPLVHALRPLSESGAAAVFVHGSNDYYGPIAKNPLKYLLEPSRAHSRPQDIDNAALTRSLRDDLGFTDLNNGAAALELRSNALELFGLGDPHIRYHDIPAMREAIREVRGSAPTRPETGTGPSLSAGPDAVTRLGVVHAPYQEALGALLDAGADVMFAGHTHGGQVRVPGVGALTANCDLPTAQARGLSVWYDAHRAAFLNVSAGLGASIYSPVRFACRPEVSLLTLEAAREVRGDEPSA